MICLDNNLATIRFAIAAWVLCTISCVSDRRDQVAEPELMTAEDRYGPALAPFANGCLFEGRHAEYGTALAGAMERGEVEESFSSWELLSVCRMLAQEHPEKVIAALKKADEFSENGDTALRLGQYYMELEKFHDAAVSIKRALSKGNSQEGTAWLLLGASLYQIKDYSSAMQALTRAMEYEETEDAASDWLDYIKRQLQDVPPQG